jgi:hypothetical protein
MRDENAASKEARGRQLDSTRTLFKSCRPRNFLMMRLPFQTS